jgi:hypothetical protein
LRFFRASRHFIGTTEQTQRTTEGSEVTNTVGFLDDGLSVGVTPRLNLFFSVPLQAATRALPLRDAANNTLGEDVMGAFGPGDLILGGRGWLWEPDGAQPFNVQLGLGLKLPTGNPAATAQRRVVDAETNQARTVTQTVDQSIQPGDGGFGVVLGAHAFWQAWDEGAVYLDGTYLANPMGVNGVQTFRSRPSEAIMAIADQFLLRTGLSLTIPHVEGLGASLGGRLDGVPVYDLLGPTEGFRRPGIAIALDPGLSYAWDVNSISINLPLTLYRNRLQSATDVADGTWGDAAFADYQVALGFTRTFKTP